MRIELKLCGGDAETLLQIISFYFFGNTYLKNVCLFFSPTFHQLFSQYNLLYNSTSIRNFPINSQTALIYFWCISVFSGEHAISALWPTYLLQFAVSRDNSLCVRIYSIPQRIDDCRWLPQPIWWGAESRRVTATGMQSQATIVAWFMAHDLRVIRRSTASTI